jgi:hypothetical protein
MSTTYTIPLFDDDTFAPQWWINYVWTSEDDLFSENIETMNQHLSKHGCQFVREGSSRRLEFDSAESYVTFVMRHVES